MREFSKKNFIIIFLIFACIYPLSLYTKAQMRTFSHDEEKDYGPTEMPHVYDTKVYDDGTVVAKIIRKNANTSTPYKDCFLEMLSLRIIHLNGTVVEKDIKLDIPQFNYCDGFLDYHLIRKNHTLVTYFNATN